MILPSKYVTAGRSLIGCGAELITFLEEASTVSRLWDRASRDPRFPTFDRFVMTLDFLYTLGLIDLQDGLVKLIDVQHGLVRSVR